MAEHLHNEPSSSAPRHLAGNEVHIWYIFTDAEPLESCQLSLENSLSAPEKDKYSSLRFPHVRQNFLLSRGCLRHLLGHYLDLPPDSLEFAYGPYGKPAILRTEGQPTVQFNLSHSEKRLAIALHPHYPIGIDIEQVRPVTHLEGLCHRCLSPNESRTVLSLASPLADSRFLSCWTAKEALLKAMGVGLSLPMNQIEVNFIGDRFPHQPLAVPVAFLKGPEDDPAQGRFQLYQWQPEPGYLAAFAIEAQERSDLPKIILHQTTPPALVHNSSSKSE